MPNQKRLIISIGLIVVIVAGGWFAFSFFDQSSSNNQKVVATVNGESIYQKELDGRIKQLEQQMSSQPGAKLDQKQLEQQALDQMISTVLVKQEAKNQGVEVSNKEVKREIESLKETLSEDTSYKEQLKAAGLTKEEHEAMVREQLLTNKYLQNQVPQDEVEVTDEQMQEAYKQISAQQDLPPLGEMEEKMKQQLRSQVARQQRNQFIQDLIKSLREKAEIETSL